MPGRILLIFLLALAFLPAAGQRLPNKIRGYTVYDPVRNGSQGPVNADVDAAFDRPQLVSAGLTGVTLQIGGTLISKEQSAEIDFLMFRDVRVNGVDVFVEEYDAKFDLRRGRPQRLPRPAIIFLPTTQMMKAVWNEMVESKKMWRVTGRVFVFGKFRKYGFGHKRVVPIDFDLTIGNPMLPKANAPAAKAGKT